MTIAKEFGWRVDGIDLHPGFVAHARDRAAAADLAHLCSFEVGDFATKIRDQAVYDGFLLEAEATAREGFEYYRNHDDTIAQLTAHGDRLVRELVADPVTLAALNEDLDVIVTRDTLELAERRPELRERLELFLEAERAEGDFLEEHTSEAVWLLERAP